ncbi:MAG: sigma-70 family RNA polymerase sigma factor [Candidatus Acidiferrales bacterium]
MRRKAVAMTMGDLNWLAERFEENRSQLRAIAYRMLGSLSEADDAVQESWLRLSRTGADGIENLGGWLTTVVARVCLDMLRSRQLHREESLDAQISAAAVPRDAAPDPEREAVLADSVGLALLVVLETLAPDERLAFVLHDMFAVPFEEIAAIVGRSPDSARQLASRARRRVQGSSTNRKADLASQRKVVDAFIAAARSGDLEGLLAILQPDVVRGADRVVIPPNGSEIRGATNVAKGALGGARRGGIEVHLMLVNGAVGAIVAPHGHLSMALTFEIHEGKIAELAVIADPAVLSKLDLAVLDD